jgi:hypothetical protein
MLIVKDTLNAEVSGIEYDGNLPKRAARVSKMMKYALGLGHWQVIFVKGKHARRFVCSRNYFCIMKKKDGLIAYLWVNRFVSLSYIRCKRSNSSTGQCLDFLTMMLNYSKDLLFAPHKLSF